MKTYLVKAMEHETISPEHYCCSYWTLGKNIVHLKPISTKWSLAATKQGLQNSRKVHEITKIYHIEMSLLRSISEKSKRQNIKEQIEIKWIIWWWTLEIICSLTYEEVKPALINSKSVSTNLVASKLSIVPSKLLIPRMWSLASQLASLLFLLLIHPSCLGSV